MQKVEVEGGELALQNSNGDIAIIPKKYRREVEDMIKDGCYDCLDDFVSKLPSTTDYAEAGALFTNETDPIKQKTEQKPRLNKKEYSKAVQQNYKSVLEKSPSIPLLNLNDGKNYEGMNCINGVCNFIGASSGQPFQYGNLKSNIGDGTAYSGNATFSDNMQKEGFYRASKEEIFEGGFQPGDIIQYSKDKQDESSRFTGKITDDNKYDQWPIHAKSIVDKYQNDKGETFYKVLDNGGNEEYRLQDWSEKELKKHITDGFKRGNFSSNSLLVNRYDPERVSQIQSFQQKEDLRLAGANRDYIYPEESNFSFNFDYENDNVKRGFSEEIQNIYKTNYDKISKFSGVDPKILDKMVEYQVGIAGQETKYNTASILPIQNLVPEGNALIAAKSVRDLLTKDDDWISSYYKDNRERLVNQYSNEDAFREHIKKKYGTTREDVAKHKENKAKGLRSKGAFKQKELSKTGEALIGNTKDWDKNLDTQFMGSIGLMIDNFHQLKNKYPNRSDQEILDLAVLSHNSPSKAMIPEYVDYYLPKNDIDYVNKIKKQAVPIVEEGTIQREPIKLSSGKNIIGATNRKANNIIPKKDTQLIDYINNL